MKYKLTTNAICLTGLTFCNLGYAGVAIDGYGYGYEYEYEYKNTIPVTEANYTDVEAEYNFLKWKKKDAMNKLFHLTQLTPAGVMPTIRMNRDTLYSAALVDASKGFKVHMPD
ncbi:MAG: hypothetical protein QNK26_09555 [Moritella sp.]|uniref:hypothetical protein n=1 Tax=Moritella sp. TaxID=78556 RepID=UPI0029A278E7|nr:hypothetical protein [Moritella sp.]MDX2320823.1 hypothetical protein [Moritella sp.]